MLIINCCYISCNNISLNSQFYRLWNIEQHHTKFDYYKKFVITVASTNFQNLKSFEPYINDTSLNNIDMLSVALMMRQLLKTALMPEFTNVITEMGICFSSTLLHFNQNPHINGKPEGPTKPITRMYNSFESESHVISPHRSDNSDNVTIVRITRSTCRMRFFAESSATRNLISHQAQNCV